MGALIGGDCLNQSSTWEFFGSMWLVLNKVFLRRRQKKENK